MEWENNIQQQTERTAEQSSDDSSVIPLLEAALRDLPNSIYWPDGDTEQLAIFKFIKSLDGQNFETADGIEYHILHIDTEARGVLYERTKDSQVGSMELKELLCLLISSNLPG